MTTRASKKGKKKADAASTPARKTETKTARAISDRKSNQNRAFCELLSEVKEDRKPIEALFNDQVFSKRFRAIIAAYKQKPEDAEELANDVLYKVSRSLQRFEPDYKYECGNFFAWLRKLTRHRFLDTLPDDDAEFSDDTAEGLRPSDQRLDPVTRVLCNEIFENLERQISTLPVKKRLAATCYFHEGLSTGETSERLTEAGFPSRQETVRRWVSEVLKDALIMTRIVAPGIHDFGAILSQAIPLMPDAIARHNLLSTGLVPYKPLREFPRCAQPNLLEELELEFDGLLASMQTTRSKRAVQTAFEASPTQLGRAAVKHANRKR